MPADRRRTEWWRAVCCAPLFALLLLSCAACGHGDGPDAPNRTASALVLSLTGLATLDAAREGSYEAWLVDAAGRPHSAGRFVAAPTVALAPAAPVQDVTGVLITVQPPGVTRAEPSAQQLLQGTIAGSRAELSVVGAVTQGSLSLQRQPGQFTIFTPSDNAVNGYPSNEEAGVWLFNMAPFRTPQQDMWVRLTPLQPGWIYEGWVVRDLGSPLAVWLSLGKFLPDQGGAVNSRDDDGWGPFSSVLDFASETSEEFPGSDFISNPLNLPVPGNLTLPLNLLETTVAGAGRWTHVISIEPAWKKGEPLATERPFILRPYFDAVGSAGPGVPRTITFRPEGVPRGTAELR